MAPTAPVVPTRWVVTGADQLSAGRAHLLLFVVARPADPSTPQLTVGLPSEAVEQ